MRSGDAGHSCTFIALSARVANRRGTVVRVFLDDVGIRWEVREIRDSSLAGLSGLIPHAELAPGWLFFSSESERRQVAPYPPDWFTLSPFELGRLCRRAASVRRRRTSTAGTGHSWSKYS